MELFERLNHIAELLENNSQAQLARRVDLLPQTLNNYMNFDGQQKIRKTLLDKILVVYPQLSRDWLFFGEGEMLDAARTVEASALPDTKDRRIAELEEELKEERRLNRRLTERLLEGANSK